MYGKYRLGLEAAQIAVGEYYSIDGWTIGQVDYVAELITVGRQMVTISYGYR